MQSQFSSVATFRYSETATGGVLLKKMFLKISQLCPQACNFIEKRLQHRYETFNYDFQELAIMTKKKSCRRITAFLKINCNSPGAGVPGDPNFEGLRYSFAFQDQDQTHIQNLVQHLRWSVLQK